MEVSRDQKETRNGAEVREARIPGFFEASGKPGEDRLVMLSDGIFAIAVTLLVLGIQIPAGVNHDAFMTALQGDFLTNTLFYAITFAVLAVYWANHRQLMNIIERVDQPFVWLNLLFLAFVAFFPVASNLLKFAQFSEAVIIYTVVLACCGYSSLFLWIYAFSKHRLVAVYKNSTRNISRFIGVSIIPTFFLLSLLLLFFPHFRSVPSHIFYSWLLLPPLNILWIRILRPSRKRRTEGTAQGDGAADQG
jgi:TMEM175 potassium channel family protein